MKTLAIMWKAQGASKIHPLDDWLDYLTLV